MHPADVEKVWQLYGELIHGERDHFRLEKQFLRSTGESVWTDLTVSLLRDGRGCPRYQLALIHDITALRQLRRQLDFEARTTIRSPGLPTARWFSPNSTRSSRGQHPTAGQACAIWTSTGSRRSTTPSDTRSGTNSSSLLRRVSK